MVNSKRRLPVAIANFTSVVISVNFYTFPHQSFNNSTRLLLGYIFSLSVAFRPLWKDSHFDIFRMSMIFCYFHIKAFHLHERILFDISTTTMPDGLCQLTIRNSGSLIIWMWACFSEGYMTKISHIE